MGDDEGFDRARCEAALSEFGFELVELDQAGAPTPGRIADRLSSIERGMEELLIESDGGTGGLYLACQELGNLRLALDYWNTEMAMRAAKGGVA